MNKKITNRIVAIFNIISILTFAIFIFSSDYLMSSIATGENGGKSVYNSFIIDTLLSNIHIIIPLVHIAISTINIICAIQNKENRKLCFWQLVFGISYIWTGLSTLSDSTDIDEDIIKWLEKIIFSIVPIILAIINLVLIKKHKPKIIQIISYIATIILSILSLLEIISVYWPLIAVIMQLIYIHFQDTYVEESKSRKIVNIILYYVLQLIVTIGFLIMVLSSLLITKINDVKWENGLTELYNNITTLKGSTDEEIYIPVEANYKYGFINENGQEKISCKYDRVSFFNEIKINDSTYYIALAKQDNKFYIISKSNNSIEISGNLEKYMQAIDNQFDETMINMFNEEENDRKSYIQSFNYFLQVLTRGEADLYQQTVETNNTNSITLTEKNSKYYYNNKNYSMIIEPIYEETNYEEDYSYDDYVDDEDYYLSSSDTKYNVTITWPNGATKSSIVYLPGLDEEDATLDTFSNGYIEFENEEHTRIGWYGSDGNPIMLPNTYTIMDIKDDKAILQLYDNEDDNYDENKKYEPQFLIIDMTGKILLQSSAIDVYDNMYLVKKDNSKMVLMDKDLNIISNEYDKISTTAGIDISAIYSSYN